MTHTTGHAFFVHGAAPAAGRARALWRTLSRLATGALLLLALAAPSVASAACQEVFFSCKRLGDKDPETGLEVERGTNLRSLRSGGRSDSWIARNCRVVYAEPAGCQWRGGGGGGGGSPPPSYDAPSYTAPAYREPAGDGAAPAPAAPPARRDAWGRRTPTPAPREVEGGSPSAPAQVDASPDGGPYAAEIAAAAARYKLPAALLRAVLTVESGGNVGAVSHKGARGLMQLMPATAKALGVNDVEDPAQNIMGGARFLRILANRFQGDLVKVLSAYHAGSLRVLTRDGTPFAATDEYVRKVLRVYYQLRDQAARRG